MKRITPILIATVCLLSDCKTVSPRASIKDAEENSFHEYETVNGEPQFADDDEHFLVYWGIWRQLTQNELEQIGSSSGALISERDIDWTVNECATNARVNMDGEKVWYYDELVRDSQGQIVPIKEAPRPNFRYFSMLNLNSQHLRGAGPWVGPKKERCETMEDWDKRRHKAYKEWLDRSWAKGTKGELHLSAEHRVYKNIDILNDQKWISSKDYPHLTGEQLQIINKLSPKQWPIYFDERAHKPHLFSEPTIWKTNANQISARNFRMKLVWNWCDKSKPVQAEIFVPRGELPPAGPNRPGRSDSGQRKIKVTEIDWQ